MIDNLKDYPRPYLGPCICIDPGVHVGISFFKSGKNEPAAWADILSDARSLESTRWLENCDSVIWKLKIYLQSAASEHGIPQLSPVFIEEPKFQNTHTGFKSAASQSLTKLVMQFGRIWQLVLQYQYKPVAVPIMTYKGQMQKVQVQHRLKRAIGNDFASTPHAADSIAIGLYLRGKFK